MTCMVKYDSNNGAFIILNTVHSSEASNGLKAKACLD